jgi:hypothetical protein
LKESSTYQAILAEGAVIEARKVLRMVGEDAFGQPDASTVALIDQLTELTRLEQLLKRLRRSTSWEELFAPPVSRRGKRKGSP